MIVTVILLGGEIGGLRVVGMVTFLMASIRQKKIAGKGR
jgi:hypothetical protein